MQVSSGAPSSCLAIAAIVILASSDAPAQIGGNGSDGVFAPAQNTVLDTAQNGGVFQFTRMHVPPGVDVTITGPNPAVLLSQGEVLVEGRLLADGETPPFDGWPGPGRGGPGGWAGGRGSQPRGGDWVAGEAGEGPGGGGFVLSTSPGASTDGRGASHATQGGQGSATYGAAFPFDMRGGSGGGGGVYRGPNAFPGHTSGAGGGGTLVILSDGSIAVTGRVSARGGDFRALNTFVYGGGGSGGSILLRALGGVRVAPSGEVLATGGWHIWGLGSPQRKSGGDGWIRIDSYDSPPDLEGTVDPAPLSMRLPALRQTAPPRLGATWRAALVAVPGDACLVLLSTRQVSIPVPPFGLLEVDPLVGLVAGPIRIPATGTDPRAEIAVPLPADPRLAGVRFFVQAVNAVSATGRPRLTNLLGPTLPP